MHIIDSHFHWRPRSLLDVAPTILEGMGFTPSPELRGRSFLDPVTLSG